MNAQDLSSLRTIGSITSTSRGGGAINTGAASSSFVSAQAFANVANPQINDVLQRVPDVTLQHMGSQPDVSIVLGGVQPYETQVLIDGHPLALGQFGVWTSQYFPRISSGASKPNPVRAIRPRSRTSPSAERSTCSRPASRPVRPPKSPMASTTTNRSSRTF
jgi:hypothetical protein